MYTYVANNPLSYTDPSGQNWLKDSWNAIKKGAVQTYNWFLKSDQERAQDVLDFSTAAGKATYQFIIGDDIDTLNNPNSTVEEKADALFNLVLIIAPTGEGQLAAVSSKITKKFGVKISDELIERVENKIAKACNCFIGGTKVQTDEGEKNIEDIEVGDMVLSKDENTGEVSFKEVSATFNHETGTDEIYKVHVGDQVIEATFNHPFWVDRKGWTFVKDLEVGDLLVQSDGNKLEIDSIELEHESARVYNMTVDEFHTYFVSDLGIWVHNTNCVLNQSTKWNIKIDARAKVSYNFNGQKVTAYQDNTKKGYYWAKDLTGHGDSAFKVFEKVGNELRWVADADEYGNFISGKHKSQTGTVIKLK